MTRQGTATAYSEYGHQLAVINESLGNPKCIDHIDAARRQVRRFYRRNLTVSGMPDAPIIQPARQEEAHQWPMESPMACVHRQRVGAPAAAALDIAILAIATHFSARMRT